MSVAGDGWVSTGLQPDEGSGHRKRRSLGLVVLATGITLAICTP
jgi:hypothetical protein